MPLRTVRDLKNYLATQKMSPEALGKDIKISNMTIRRMLRRPPAATLPEKYHLALDEHCKRAQRGSMLTAETTASPAGLSDLAVKLLSAHEQNDQGESFAPLLEELERSGREVTDMQGLESKVQATMQGGRFDQRFKAHVKTLFAAIRSNKTTIAQRAICAGALLYFINPFDLIPDTLPVIGYLDDFAVFSLVVALLAKNKNSTRV